MSRPETYFEDYVAGDVHEFGEVEVRAGHPDRSADDPTVELEVVDQRGERPDLTLHAGQVGVGVGGDDDGASGDDGASPAPPPPPKPSPFGDLPAPPPR